jgi:hypothetical protein
MRDDVVKADRILIDPNGKIQARNTLDTQTFDLLDFPASNRIRVLQTLDMNNQTILNVPTPTSPSHPTTKAYVDGLGPSGDVTNIDAGNAGTNFASLPVFDGGNA